MVTFGLVMGVVMPTLGEGWVSALLAQPVSSKGVGDMRNRVAAWALALICLLAAGAARAEAVWVREDWQQLTGEYDCGGVRLSVDARAMILPAGATVQSYRAPRLSRARLIALGEAIDWAALGLDTA